MDADPVAALQGLHDRVAELERTLTARLDEMTAQVAGLADNLVSLSSRASDLEGRATADGRAVEDLAASLRVTQERLPVHSEALSDLRADLAETTHDLAAVATLLGHQVGEPFRSQAAEILAKRQTGGEESR